jgi:hypothetical protein
MQYNKNKEDKMKRYLVALTLAIIAILSLNSNVMAAGTVFWSGTTVVANTEPITISRVSGDGTFDDGTHAWNVSIIGGGTLHLVLKAKNNSTVPYTVTSIVNPVGTPLGVTATWNPPSKYLAAGAEQDFTLTVVVSADAPIATSNFDISFSR